MLYDTIIDLTQRGWVDSVEGKDIEEENRLYAELVKLQGELQTHSEEYIKFMRSADPQWQKAALEQQVKDLLNQQAEK